jgi:type IV pilus assembly protein PilV
MTVRASARLRQSGFTLLEVLITVIILAFGLLSLANLQAKMHQTELESYQRAQAVLLVQDMSARIFNNRGAGGLAAAEYVTGTAAPLGFATTVDCAAPATQAAKDKCEWSNALKGAAETKGGATVGAMIGARGCIEQIQAANPAEGFCVPGIYRLTVAWQGLASTSAPKLACGKDLYGADEQRRVFSTVITIGVPRCVGA